MPLSKLTSEHIQRELNRIIAAGKGKTADLLRAVLRSAFNKAVKLRRLSINPVLARDPVRYVQQQTATFSAEEGSRLLHAAERERFGALFVVALSLGLRKGEVLGLKPDDIDLTNGVVHVRRSLEWVKMPDEDTGHWIEREPKRGSRRELPITETIRRALVHHFALRRAEAPSAGECWIDSGYVFVSPDRSADPRE